MLIEQNSSNKYVDFNDCLSFAAFFTAISRHDSCSLRSGEILAKLQ